MRVDDEAVAIDALGAVLEDKVRARDALHSRPAVLVHGITTPEFEALREQLSPHGITLHARPSRRYPAVEGASSAGGTEDGTAAQGNEAPRHDDTQLGVAKVSYYAALVAAPAYVLQPSVLLAIAALTALTMASWFGLMTGSIIVAFGAPLAVSGLRFAVFALIVRRSRTGQTDLRLGDDARDPLELVSAGVRIVLVSLSAFSPFLLVSWSATPQLVRYGLPGHAGVSTIEFLAALLLLLVTFLLPLLALPGTYAAAALGTGCASIHPFIGVVVARRIPGPYLLTLAYLAACWFGSIALMLGGMLSVSSSAWSAVNGSEGAAGAVVPLLLVTGFMTVMDVTSTLISARVLGLLTYHYREELGL